MEQVRKAKAPAPAGAWGLAVAVSGKAPGADPAEVWDVAKAADRAKEPVGWPDVEETDKAHH